MEQVMVGLNWTKVGLKDTIAAGSQGMFLRLNWTKVGLKGIRAGIT